MTMLWLGVTQQVSMGHPYFVGELPPSEMQLLAARENLKSVD